MKRLILLAIVPLALAGCTSEPETVEQTPQACVDALDAAEALVRGPVVEQSEDSVVLIGLIPQAFEAGLMGDRAAADSIIATMDEVNVRTENRTAEIEKLVAEYNAAAEECRGDGSNT